MHNGCCQFTLIWNSPLNTSPGVRFSNAGRLVDDPAFSWSLQVDKRGIRMFFAVDKLQRRSAFIGYPNRAVCFLEARSLAGKPFGNAGGIHGCRNTSSPPLDDVQKMNTVARQPPVVTQLREFHGTSSIDLLGDSLVPRHRASCSIHPRTICPRNRAFNRFDSIVRLGEYLFEHPILDGR